MPKIGSVVSAVILLVAMVGATPRHSRRSAPPRVLRGQIRSIERRKHEVRSKLHETRVAAISVRKVIDAVDDRLTQVQSRLTQTQQALIGARRQQVSASNDLQNATAELKRVREQARVRLRAIGKQGDANVLVAFVSARSVGDLAERKDLMERIARKDHQLFDRVRRLQRTIAERKARRDAAVVRVASLAGRERAQQADLCGVRSEKTAVLQGLRRKETDYEETLSQFDDDEKEIRRLIALANRPVRRPGHAPVPAFIGRFLKPVNAPITSTFGMRFHPILHRYRLHAGVDFGAPIGTPVRCAGPGEVVAATCMRGFGNVVIVDHGGGISTVYAHLSRIGVRPGQKIGQGQVLGAVGMTGLATGPHLHWEVHVGGRAVDPLGRS